MNKEEKQVAERPEGDPEGRDFQGRRRGEEVKLLGMGVGALPGQLE